MHYRDGTVGSHNTEADKKFSQQMNLVIDALIDNAGGPVMLKDLCKGEDKAAIRAWLEKEYPDKMDGWSDAKELYDELIKTLDTGERGDHVYKTYAVQPDGEAPHQEWSTTAAAAKLAQQDKSEEPPRHYISEDRRKRIKFNEKMGAFNRKMDAATEDYHVRTYGAASSSSKQRQDTDDGQQKVMDDDDWVAAEEIVDFSE